MAIDPRITKIRTAIGEQTRTGDRLADLDRRITALERGGAQPAARAYRNSSLTLITGWQKVPVDTLSFDPTGAMDVVTNHRYNVPTTGYYHVNAQVSLVLQNNPQQYGVAVWLNGVIGTGAQNTPTIRGGAANDGLGSAVSDIISCQAGNFLELWAYNVGAAGCALIIAPSVNFLSVMKV